MATTANPQPDDFPVTKVLAIGTVGTAITRDEVERIMPAEVRATVALYLEGKIDQWFAQHGGGVMFLVNAESLHQAEDLLSGLPLAKAGYMSFKLTALGPLTPLHALIQD